MTNFCSRRSIKMNRTGALLLMLIVAVPSLAFTEDITLIKHASRKGSPPGESTRYVVKQGDTLKKIFLKDFGARPDDLTSLYREFRQINPNVADLDRIMPDRAIAIPKVQRRTVRVQAPEKDSSGDFVVIRQGQYLAKVLRNMYGLTDDVIFHQYLKKIKELNPHIKDLNLVVAGQKIRLPEIRYAQKKGAVKTVQKETPPEAGESPALRKAVKVKIEEIDEEEKPGDLDKKQDVVQKPALDVAQSGQGKSELPQEKKQASEQGLQKALEQKAASGPTGEGGNTGSAGQDDAIAEGQGSNSTAASGEVTHADSPQEKAAIAFVKEKVFPSLKDMGVRLSDRGTYFMPLADGKSIAIDTSAIPVIDFDTGIRIVLDVNNRISPETKGRLEKAYPNTKVVSGPSEGIEPLMEKILNTCGYFSVNKDAGPVLVGGEEKLRFFGKWVVYKDLSRRKVFIINILSDKDFKTPEVIRNYASRFGINLIEMGGRQYLPRKGSSGTLTGFNHSYEKLLDGLGVTYEKQKELELVSQDDLKITYTAPFIIGKTALTEELPDKTMLDLLKKKGYTVVHTGTQDLKSVLIALGLKKEGPPIRVIVSRNRTELDLPAVHVGKIIVLEHTVDTDVARYLSSCGLKIVVW
jgi:hypothetical protein